MTLLTTSKLWNFIFNLMDRHWHVRRPFLLLLFFYLVYEQYFQPLAPLARAKKDIGNLHLNYLHVFSIDKIILAVNGKFVQIRSMLPTWSSSWKSKILFIDKIKIIEMKNNPMHHAWDVDQFPIFRLKLF